VWRKPRDLKPATQRKSLGNKPNQDREDQFKSFSQKPFSLIFQTLIKNTKRLFTLKSKPYFSCSKNTREIENFSPKILREKLSQMEYL